MVEQVVKERRELYRNILNLTDDLRGSVDR